MISTVETTALFNYVVGGELFDHVGLSPTPSTQMTATDSENSGPEEEQIQVFPNIGTASDVSLVSEYYNVSKMPSFLPLQRNETPVKPLGQQVTLRG